MVQNMYRTRRASRVNKNTRMFFIYCKVTKLLAHHEWRGVPGFVRRTRNLDPRNLTEKHHVRDNRHQKVQQNITLLHLPLHQTFSDPVAVREVHAGRARDGPTSVHGDEAQPTHHRQCRVGTGGASQRLVTNRVRCAGRIAVDGQGAGTHGRQGLGALAWQTGVADASRADTDRFSALIPRVRLVTRAGRDANRHGPTVGRVARTKNGRHSYYTFIKK